ncbi:MAG: hypothetical protein AAF386_14000, partial [Pseudomonadota bacterium]
MEKTPMRRLPLNFANLCASVAILVPTFGTADIAVRFIEGAPKDRFVIENKTGCDVPMGQVIVDLSSSAAGLIFDTAAAGQGVEVFQPLEIISGAALLSETPTVADGDTGLTLPFTGFPAGAQIAFTIDVDDTLPAGQSGQIIVRGGEFQGASVAVAVGTATHRATFAENARANVA